MTYTGFMKLTILTLVLFSFIQPTFSQDFKGRFREKLKERWIKKQEQVPAPVADTSSDAPITKPGDYTLMLEHNKLLRMYRLHVPKKYDVTKPTPLLFSLHGGAGNMSYQATDKYYKQISKSEEAGFIVVFPNGFSKLASGKFATWNAGKCCGEARDNSVDDVGFIKEVLTKVSKQLNIDKNKIYASGMSNGAMMAYRLACEMPDTFKGIAAVAGTDNTVECSPKNPISILHIHAKNDNHVLFDGGSGPGSVNKAAITDYKSVPVTISKWVKQNGCNETPKRILEKTGAYCDLYSSCKNNVKVQLCLTKDGGHSWPGGEKVRGGDVTSKAISANDVMWEFFK